METFVPQKESGVVIHGVKFHNVPEECVAAIAAYTTPTDACRLALVSRDFMSASESDVVWERFLPSDCDLIVARSVGGDTLLAEIQTKKQLYMLLADRPLLIDGSSKSFWQDKSSGNKCWMIAARSLSIIWSDTPRYWKWTSNPESGFPEVAELLSVCWLEIRGMIKTSTLSPGTHYIAHLILKITDEAFGLHNISEASIGTVGGKTETQSVHLSTENRHFQSQRLLAPRQFPMPPPRQFLGHRVPPRGFINFRGLQLPSFECQQEITAGVHHSPKQRTDGWQELKIGEFFTNPGEEDEIELSVLETKTGNWKRGLIIEGIEIRPAYAIRAEMVFVVSQVK